MLCAAMVLATSRLPEQQLKTEETYGSAYVPVSGVQAKHRRSC